MLTKVKRFFSPKSSGYNDSLVDKKFNAYIENEKGRLEDSLQLLKKTTNEVSVAAVNAAIALEQQLKDTEYRFFSTIDTIDDLVIIKDGLGRWKTVNTVGQEIFGWHHNEYYNKTDAELIESYPNYKETLDFCMQSDDETWSLGRSNRFEERVQYGTTHRILDIIKTPVFNPDGSRKELIIVGRDMTKMIEKQRRTKACFHALNSASDGIVIIDSNYKIIFSNDEFNRKFHIENYESILNKKMFDVLPWLVKYNDLLEHARNNKSINVATEEAGDIAIMPMMNGCPKPIYYICTFKK